MGRGQPSVMKASSRSIMEAVRAARPGQGPASSPGSEAGIMRAKLGATPPRPGGWHHRLLSSWLIIESRVHRVTNGVVMSPCHMTAPSCLIIMLTLTEIAKLCAVDCGKMIQHTPNFKMYIPQIFIFPILIFYLSIYVNFSFRLHGQQSQQSHLKY